MARYRLERIASLARQLKFVPVAVRDRQLAAAEELLGSIEPSKAYPLDFVTFRITGFNLPAGEDALLAGIALQHDLGLLIEDVSVTLDQRTEDRREPVLSIDDLCRTFNVTSKTLQRWRRKGLSARRFIFPDGKRRVGFRLAVVENFLSRHGPSVRRASNPTEISAGEHQAIIRYARRLAKGCSAEEICRRIARRLDRSPLTIDATLRKHDAENPNQAVLSNAQPALREDERLIVQESLDAGESIRVAAARVRRNSGAVYAIALSARLERLTKRRVKFFDDPLYHQDDAFQSLTAMQRQGDLAPAESAEQSRVPGELPSYLRSLYSFPLLSPAKERALFLLFNYHKFRFVTACRRLDPAKARARDIDSLEHLRKAYIDVRNRIAQANLRLVVSVASKHVRGGVTLMELVSEGNIVLLRAIEGFDTHKGNRFSTYATLALMKGFARSVPQLQTAARKLRGDPERLAELACRGDAPWERPALRDEARRIFDSLTAADRDAAQMRFDFANLAPM